MNVSNATITHFPVPSVVHIVGIALVSGSAFILLFVLAGVVLLPRGFCSRRARWFRTMSSTLGSAGKTFLEELRGEEEYEIPDPEKDDPLRGVPVVDLSERKAKKDKEDKEQEDLMKEIYSSYFRCCCWFWKGGSLTAGIRPAGARGILSSSSKIAASLLRSSSASRSRSCLEGRGARGSSLV